jgi:hypothetical protein
MVFVHGYLLLRYRRPWSLEEPDRRRDGGKERACSVVGLAWETKGRLQCQGRGGAGVAHLELLEMHVTETPRPINYQ